MFKWLYHDFTGIEQVLKYTGGTGEKVYQLKAHSTPLEDQEV